MYRLIAVRVAYLAVDRPDLQQCIRGLAKGLRNPNERHWVALKRVARYLKGRPRLGQKFPCRGSVASVTEWKGNDPAGCIHTRRRASYSVLMMGRCVGRTSPKGHAVIAPDSGVTEYYGLVRGVSQIPGATSLAQDWGMPMPGHVWVNPAAGTAIGSRCGLGKVAHIGTVLLRVQEVISAGRVTVGKNTPPRC